MADKPLFWEILACPSFISEDNVCVSMVKTANRKPHPDAAVENEIERRWEMRLKDNPKMFNALKFRLGQFHWSDEGHKHLHLELGITDYKTFQATNRLSEVAAKLYRDGLEEEGDGRAFLGDALGIGTILKTSDGKYLFIKRSMHVGEAAGKIDTAGGHPEPSAIEPKDVWEKGSEESIVHELFDAMTKEVIDEINLPRNTLTAPKMIGLLRNRTTGGRPSISFYMETTMPEAEARKLYTLGGPEKDESVDLISLAHEDLHAIVGNDSYAPACQGIVSLYLKGNSKS